MNVSSFPDIALFCLVRRSTHFVRFWTFSPILVTISSIQTTSRGMINQISTTMIAKKIAMAKATDAARIFWHCLRVSSFDFCLLLLYKKRSNHFMIGLSRYATITPTKMAWRLCKIFWKPENNPSNRSTTKKIAIQTTTIKMTVRPIARYGRISRFTFFFSGCFSVAVCSFFVSSCMLKLPF